MIRGWANYHRHIVSTETFKYVDYQIYIALWRWAKRRHPNKGKYWISARYFHMQGDINRYFSCIVYDEVGKARNIILTRAQNIRIRRHTVIYPTANPFDKECDGYFERRISASMHHNKEGRQMLNQLRTMQQNICPECEEALSSRDKKGVIHYRKSRLNGGQLNL
jgi:RNA-directed DNA polymerase